VETLIKNADTAMNRAKAEGGSKYRFYDTHMSHEVEEQLIKQVELRKALQNREFRLFFQPRMDTVSQRIIGAEALIRWDHPSRGLLEPESFIAAAEESGMVVSLDKWLLDAVCREIAGWQKDGLPAILTTVNVSGLQFMDKDYADYLRKMINVTRIDPHNLGLEITEGVLIEHTEQVNTVFRDIKALGMQLLLDDFGTRYSSLSYLKRFPIDTLKIDRSFIHDIPNDNDGCALVEAMINIAHSLRMNVVAEGVETDAQLTWLKQKKCDSIQGYLTSRPMPASEFRHHIAQRTPTERLSN
jgi:EAL domain-containing protein (putative c-di-GMP-specific phosphodiesterase class I)